MSVIKELEKMRIFYMHENALIVMQMAEKNAALLEYREKYDRLKRQLEVCRLQRNAQIVFPELKYTIEELDLEIEKTK